MSKKEGKKMVEAVITNVEVKNSVAIVKFKDSRKVESSGIYDLEEYQAVVRERGDIVGREVVIYSTPNPLKPQIAL
jgi:uncharacterized protein (DUF1330 family)